MNWLLSLAWSSLKNRRLSSVLTVLSIALSVSLLLAVEKARKATEDGFTQTISKTDLIVGARSGPLQLLLYTVFNMGNATHNISYEIFQKFSEHPAVDWVIPYSLGDGHRGFRVVGTNSDFFAHYRFRGNENVQFQEGRAFSNLWDVVIGAEVAKKLGYSLGQKVIVAHGVTRTEGIQKHDDKPFTVVGILKATGTPLDRAVYMSLQGLEAVHLDWESGAAPTPDKVIPASAIKAEELKISTITSFFLGAKSRIETLRLQREINNYSEEPLLAIIPGVVLSELWNSLGNIEKVLKGISWMVVSVGLVSMLIALLTSLNERRREMAILRAMGASPLQISYLLVLESFVLTLVGVILGAGGSLIVFALVAPWLESQYGLYMTSVWFTTAEWTYLGMTLIAGLLVGLIPATRAKQQALKDGLSSNL